MNLNQFLPQDQWQAAEEDNCVKNCLFSITASVANYDYESALYVLEHTKRSLIELQKMKGRKEFNDKKVALAMEFIKAGVDIESALHRI